MNLNLASLLPSEEQPQLAESPSPSLSEESQSPLGSESQSDEQPFDHDIFERMLQIECKGWQKKLRLQDWNVHVSLVRLNEMPGKEALGAIFPSIERKDALMKVLSPMDVPLIAENFQGSEEMNYGLTIVHELIHLHLWPFTQNQTEAELTAEEQAVNALSRCIVNAYAHKVKPLLPSATANAGHYL